MRRAALIVNGLFGLWAFGSGVGHLVAVVVGFVRSGAFVYDFRAYSLMLLGVAIAGPGLLAALATWGMARGELGAYRRALAMAFVVLLVTAPAMPIQVTGLPVGAVVDLVLLSVARRRLVGIVGG